MKKRRLTYFGQLVNNRLVELNMTQKKLAKMVGTSEVYLSMILRGKRSGNKYIDSIAEVLNIDISHLDRRNLKGKRER